MKQKDPAIVERLDSQVLANRIRDHAIEHGWHNVARVLREEVFVHVGWDSDFTELDNVLRRMANVPPNANPEKKLGTPGPCPRPGDNACDF